MFNGPVICEPLKLPLQSSFLFKAHASRRAPLQIGPSYWRDRFPRDNNETGRGHRPSKGALIPIQFLFDHSPIVVPILASKIVAASIKAWAHLGTVSSRLQGPPINTTGITPGKKLNFHSANQENPVNRQCKKPPISGTNRFLPSRDLKIFTNQ